MHPQIAENFLDIRATIRFAMKVLLDRIKYVYFMWLYNIKMELV